eukprot:1762349-Pyramimonas_sp.AAC.1
MSTTHTRTTRPPTPGAASARTAGDLAPDAGHCTDACQKGQTHRAVQGERDKHNVRDLCGPVGQGSNAKQHASPSPRKTKPQDNRQQLGPVY